MSEHKKVTSIISDLEIELKSLKKISSLKENFEKLERETNSNLEIGAKNNEVAKKEVEKMIKTHQDYLKEEKSKINALFDNHNKNIEEITEALEKRLKDEIDSKKNQLEYEISTTLKFQKFNIVVFVILSILYYFTYISL
jgi:aspartate/tyrosine/aromatic aminotransferase